MYTIDIDIGGTFTDGVFTAGQDLYKIKVFTTPHDLAECVIQCIKEASAQMNVSLKELVGSTQAARLSTTVGTNALIQRTGPKLGVLVAAGEEESLYGDGVLLQGESPVVAADMVAGAESLNLGSVLDEDAVLGKVQKLVQNGARTLVVSGRKASRNKQVEDRIRKLIKHHYPQHYLRYVPVQVSTDVSDFPDDGKRTNTAVINAYLHQDMARTLYRIEDKLRELGLKHPLQIVHANGGTARVAKTLAISTYSSGPVAGVVGLMTVAQMIGVKNAIATDMGGTSLDVGILVDGRIPITLEPFIDNVRVSYPMIQVSSIGSGGGSIAEVSKGDLQVGPRSAGSLPGPVCYDRGGSRPTVTDADVALGYIDPDHFLAGRIPLNREKAIQAIAEQIAGPLGVAVPEAAMAIRDVLARQIGAHLRKRLIDEGIEPGEATLFAYGGAGAVHCCDYAGAAGINTVVTFPFGSVCNAFGSSTMDIAHTYLRSLPEDRPPAETKSAAQEAVLEMIRRAMLDARSELREAGELYLKVGLFVRENGSTLHLHGEEFPQTGSEGIEQQAGYSLQQLYEQTAGREVVAVTLSARIPIPHWRMPVHAMSDPDPSAALKAKRNAFWHVSGEVVEVSTPVYDFERLQSGNEIAGPAIVELSDTVCVVPYGWQYRLDEKKMGWLEKQFEGSR